MNKFEEKILTSKYFPIWLDRFLYYMTNRENFYFGYSDYRFRFSIRLFGKDILCLKTFDLKRKLRKAILRLFGITGIQRIKKSWIIYFKNSVWKIGEK